MNNANLRFLAEHVVIADASVDVDERFPLEDGTPWTVVRRGQCYWSGPPREWDEALDRARACIHG